VSHIPQRKEKDCLNCGAIVQGRYCHVCGQENVVPKETFWHMVTHFFYDVTHFDSNFFHTVHHLILKPGFLSKEYLRGRRASYLHPIRMYVFTSAIFFLLFFSVFGPKTFKTNLHDKINPAHRERLIRDTRKQLEKDTANSILKGQLTWLLDTSRLITELDASKMEVDSDHNIRLTSSHYHSRKEYDSLQHLLPRAIRDGWFRRRLELKQIDINEKWNENPEEAVQKFTESLLHRLPYLLFLSLPLFALILKLIYVRRRQFLYADHGVFTIHLYVFTFLMLLAVFIVEKLSETLHFDGGWLIFVLFVLLFFYLYKAMRNFYGQRRGKTFLKFIFLCILSLIMMLILFIFFLFFSAVTF
jgi:hypothetical protein